MKKIILGFCLICIGLLVNAQKSGTNTAAFVTELAIPEDLKSTTEVSGTFQKDFVKNGISGKIEIVYGTDTKIVTARLITTTKLPAEKEGPGKGCMTACYRSCKDKGDSWACFASCFLDCYFPAN